MVPREIARPVAYYKKNMRFQVGICPEQFQLGKIENRTDFGPTLK